MVFVRDCSRSMEEHSSLLTSSTLFSESVSSLPCLFKLRSLVNNLVPGGFMSSLCDQCDEKVVEMLRYYYGSNNKRSDFERSRSIRKFLIKNAN